MVELVSESVTATSGTYCSSQIESSQRGDARRPMMIRAPSLDMLSFVQVR